MCTNFIVKALDGSPLDGRTMEWVMSNASGYDWHLLKLRNYANLQAQDMSGLREINGINLAPFGVGSGMLGLAGGITQPSRFVRAVTFT